MTFGEQQGGGVCREGGNGLGRVGDVSPQTLTSLGCLGKECCSALGFGGEGGSIARLSVNSIQVERLAHKLPSHCN